METNFNSHSQIILIKKIMEIENVSFNTAIQIIDRLNEADLLDYYINEMHKEDFEQLKQS